MDIEVPEKIGELFEPERGSVRYRGAYGGRGSGKSFSFALMAAVWGYSEPLRILCTRDLQISIKESFHAEVKAAIASNEELAEGYDVGEHYIRGINGTEFLFKGLRHNITAIKSMAQIDLCIVEEAEDVPDVSWRDLIPTIRAPKSEIWAIWNPQTNGSPVDLRFRKRADRSMVVAECNYADNPWFPDVLEQERRRDLRHCDPSIYAHIWDGAYLEISDAQIFNGCWSVEEFEPCDNWDGPYFGVDWGFAGDPTTIIKSWINGRTLLIEYDAGGVGIEIDEIPQLFATVPGSNSHTIRADSTRPEMISHIKRLGFPNISSVDKWPGSIKGGIAFIRSFDRVVIHPRCKGTATEFRLYSYKKDRVTGDILPIVVDAHNHYIDALRYALAPAILNQRSAIEFISAGRRTFADSGRTEMGSGFGSISGGNDFGGW